MVRVILVLFFIGVCFLIFAQTYWWWAVGQARRRGVYPEKGEPTLFDVKRLIESGDRFLAVRLYCQIFRVSSHDAAKAVEELERGMRK